MDDKQKAEAIRSKFPFPHYDKDHAIATWGLHKIQAETLIANVMQVAKGPDASMALIFLGAGILSAAAGQLSDKAGNEAMAYGMVAVKVADLLHEASVTAVVEKTMAALKAGKTLEEAAPYLFNKPAVN